MIARILALALVFSVFASCAQDGRSYLYVHNRPNGANTRDRIPVYVDNRLAAWETEAVFGAVDDWNYALNGALVFRVESASFDMSPTSVLADPLAVLVLRADNGAILAAQPDHTVAFTDAIGGRLVYVTNSVPSDSLRGILRHELAHILGAAHAPSDPTSLMYPVYTRDGYACIDQGTMRQVAKARWLTMSALNYCLNVPIE